MPARSQLRYEGRQVIECGPERLADQLEPIEVAGGGQDVGRVGALAGTGLEQAPRLAGLEQLVQEDALGPAVGQA